MSTIYKVPKTIEEAEKRTEEWHENYGEIHVPLHEYLGLTYEQYGNYVEKNVLPEVKDEPIPKP